MGFVLSARRVYPRAGSNDLARMGFAPLARGFIPGRRVYPRVLPRFSVFLPAWFLKNKTWHMTLGT